MPASPHCVDPRPNDARSPCAPIACTTQLLHVSVDDGTASMKVPVRATRTLKIATLGPDSTIRTTLPGVKCDPRRCGVEPETRVSDGLDVPAAVPGCKRRPARGRRGPGGGGRRRPAPPRRTGAGRSDESDERDDRGDAHLRRVARKTRGGLSAAPLVPEVERARYGLRSTS